MKYVALNAEAFPLKKQTTFFLYFFAVFENEHLKYLPLLKGETKICCLSPATDSVNHAFADYWPPWPFRHLCIARGAAPSHPSMRRRKFV